MIEIDEDDLNELKRDWNDMYNAIGTIFIRCRGCKRMREKGFICPTNQENQLLVKLRAACKIPDLQSSHRVLHAQSISILVFPSLFDVALKWHNHQV